MEVSRAVLTFASPGLDYAVAADCDCYTGCPPFKGYFYINTLGTGLTFDPSVRHFCSIIHAIYFKTRSNMYQNKTADHKYLKNTVDCLIIINNAIYDKMSTRI